MEQKATITVYDLLHEGAKKRKVLSNADLQSTEFKSIAFSPDSKYLAAQETVSFGIQSVENYAKKFRHTNDSNFGIELANKNCFKSSSPDWTIFLWVWEKNKLLTTSRTCNPVGANAASVTQISFSPQDNTLLAVSGRFSSTCFLLPPLPRSTLIGQLISIDLKTLLRKKCFKNFAIS